jgi:hypothetical protein
VELNENDLLLIPTIVYGFGFSDNAWCEYPSLHSCTASNVLFSLVGFSVEKIQPGVWNTVAFFQSPLETYHMELGFEQFIRVKVMAGSSTSLIPQVSEQLFNAEVTSEHVKCPLCVVRGGI